MIHRGLKYEWKLMCQEWDMKKKRFGIVTMGWKASKQSQYHGNKSVIISGWGKTKEEAREDYFRVRKSWIKP